MQERTNANGHLPVGFGRLGYHSDTVEAWTVVLKVIGLDLDGVPLGQQAGPAFAALPVVATVERGPMQVDEKPVLKASDAVSKNNGVSQRVLQGLSDDGVSTDAVSINVPPRDDLVAASKQPGLSRSCPSI